MYILVLLNTEKFKEKLRVCCKKTYLNVSDFFNAETRRRGDAEKRAKARKTTN